MAVEEFTNAHPALAQFWHPVALSAEVGPEPVAARLGGQGWALVRLGDGITAFADQCPHRRARLSAGQVTGGFGSGVLELIADHGLTIPVKRIGLPDHFIEQGTISTLRRDVGLTAEAVAQAARDLLYPTTNRSPRNGTYQLTGLK